VTDGGGDEHCQGCGDGGGPGDSSGEAAAPGTFGAPCTLSADGGSDCVSQDCQDFQGKGGYFCTMPCTPGPCPDGCNMMGQCKVP
jgi:hypothetical protein